MSQYTKDISYLNLLMRNSRLLFMLLVISMLGVQLGLMYNEITKVSYTAEIYSGDDSEESESGTETIQWAPSFNALLSRAKVNSCFYIFAIISLLLLPVSSLRVRLHSNADYTLHRLTLTPARQFSLHVIHSYLRILFVVFIELVTILSAYLMYHNMIDSSYHLVNELMVTYMNNQLFHFLLPVTSPVFFVMVLVNLLVLAVSCTFMSYMAVDKMYAGTILILLSNLMFWVYFMLSDGFYWSLFTTLAYVTLYTVLIYNFTKKGCKFLKGRPEGEHQINETN